MDEAQLVNCFDCKCDFSHVKSGDVFSEDLIFDKHSHKITARQELHKHVEEGVVLEGRVQLDDPRAVRLGENVTLGADVGQLVFLELCPGQYGTAN